MPGCRCTSPGSCTRTSCEVVAPPAVMVATYVPVFSGAVQSSAQLPFASAVVCPCPLPSIATVTSAFGAAVPLIVNGTTSVNRGGGSCAIAAKATSNQQPATSNRFTNTASPHTP